MSITYYPRPVLQEVCMIDGLAFRAYGFKTLMVSAVYGKYMLATYAYGEDSVDILYFRIAVVRFKYLRPNPVKVLLWGDRSYTQAAQIFGAQDLDHAWSFVDHILLHYDAYLKTR